MAATAAFLADNPLVRHDPTELVESGPRALTKAVLFPVRFLYTRATGQAGSNEDAGRWYCETGGTAADLVGAALKWRDGVVERDDAVRLVAAQLPALQAECTTAFAGE